MSLPHPQIDCSEANCLALERKAEERHECAGEEETFA
jgi:hypothetical protein